jgi:hypothetical protein
MSIRRCTARPPATGVCLTGSVSFRRLPSPISTTKLWSCQICKVFPTCDLTFEQKIETLKANPRHAIWKRSDHEWCKRWSGWPYNVNGIFTIRWEMWNGMNRGTCDMRIGVRTVSRKMDLRGPILVKSPKSAPYLHSFCSNCAELIRSQWMILSKNQSQEGAFPALLTVCGLFATSEWCRRRSDWNREPR